MRLAVAFVVQNGWWTTLSLLLFGPKTQKVHFKITQPAFPCYFCSIKRSPSIIKPLRLVACSLPALLCIYDLCVKSSIA
ncbi:hypothetical protein BDB00DRAFT_833751 [Zychaea mexicana]|uniref:uncharacterized protein n=1 Tax=Zychaea mexicana TaxID=64656 RepID=UPI0022FE38C5|nr:uncharacterized protein BDB00DRAFT_833751 [Zychaea mexicana]KAI9491273.1 hypothetical protein BDB00DRAFT_833751 [Zychaea mexicana]